MVLATSLRVALVLSVTRTSLFSVGSRVFCSWPVGCVSVLSQRAVCPAGQGSLLLEISSEFIAGVVVTPEVEQPVL